MGRLSHRVGRPTDGTVRLWTRNRQGRRDLLSGVPVAADVDRRPRSDRRRRGRRRSTEQGRPDFGLLQEQISQGIGGPRRGRSREAPGKATSHEIARPEHPRRRPGTGRPGTGAGGRATEASATEPATIEAQRPGTARLPGVRSALSRRPLAPQRPARGPQAAAEERPPRPQDRVRYAAHVDGDGRAFFAAAEERHLEGVIGKHRRSLYEPGHRTSSWLKFKVRPEQELVVGGYLPGEGTHQELGALPDRRRVRGRQADVRRAGWQRHRHPNAGRTAPAARCAAARRRPVRAGARRNR